MSADNVIDLDFRRRLRDGLDLNQCVARALRYRQQAGDLARAGRHAEASVSLEEAERAEEHAKRLATKMKERKER